MNQILIANLMASLRGNSIDVDENLLRHMVLNTIRMNRVKYGNKYGEIVIAIDSKNCWRKNVFPYYKASRKKNRDSSTLDWNTIFESFNRIGEELKEYFPYRVLKEETAEADDIIGVLCHEFGRQLGGDPILIISSDKDFIQLQKYSNVEQYDPVRKRWLSHNNPERFLIEHICRGDAGDGIPNILSPDDIFVSEGRQKPVTQKKLDVWTPLLLNETSASEVFAPELYRNWIRNEKMIDLSHVPEDLKSRILNRFEEQSNKSRNRMFNYFIKYKLKHLTESINEF